MLAIALFQVFGIDQVFPEGQDRESLALGVESIPKATVIEPVYESVPWNGREYPAAEGVDLLMGIVSNPKTDASVRARALEKLKRLGPRLRATNRVPELIAMYDGLRTREEKGALLLNLVASQDARALTLFVDTLKKEQDTVLRLVAADGLSNWNVRRGVAELIELLECTDALGSRTVRDEAANSFRRNNRVKGWGFPEREIRQSIEGRSDVEEREKIVQYIGDVRKWFAENEHRFPDWKLGDPLPESEPAATLEP